MRLFLHHFVVLIIGALYLQGCQSVDFNPKDEHPQQNPSQFEQLAKFGSDFALQLDAKPKITCKKYIQLHKNGDWRASWVLALTTVQPENIQCVNINDAILVLTTLELQNKINPDLIWLNQSYLALLFKLQENKKTISLLNQSISNSSEHSSSLEEEKKELSKKIEALKNIETNINQ
ncbi:MAG: hypothetical protein L3J59_06015 [Methylococcaceae bacterium]|nr:hypothetical protein [Methylococcaceae bacterium]